MRVALNACRRFSADQRGVVSFEYVVVAAAIVAAMVAVFGAGSTDGLATTLTNAVALIAAAVTGASGGG